MNKKIEDKAVVGRRVGNLEIEAPEQVSRNVKSNLNKKREIFHQYTDKLLVEYQTNIFQRLDQEEDQKYFKLNDQCLQDPQKKSIGVQKFQQQMLGDLEKGTTQEFNGFNKECIEYNANLIKGEKQNKAVQQFMFYLQVIFEYMIRAFCISL